MYEIQKYKVKLVRDGRVRVVPHEKLQNAELAADVFGAVLADLPHEELWVGLLDARLCITGLVRVSQGGIAGAAITPADVLRPVLTSGAAAFVLAHNHPGGDPSPTAEDREVTRNLLAACRAVGVTFCDHIVWSRNGWRSLSNEGLWEERR